jgi:hypothetical protein
MQFEIKENPRLLDLCLNNEDEPPCNILEEEKLG